MGKIVKSAKKFAKKHLKSTIAHRRRLKPIKQAFKRKLASSEKFRKEKLKGDDSMQPPTRKDLKDMTADEFLDGQFSDNDDNQSDWEEDDCDIEESFDVEDGEEDFVDVTPPDLQGDVSDDDDDSPLGAQNKELSSEVEKHKRQLQKLKEKDPEFFKFLEEHDKELLDFDDDDDDNEDVEEDVAKNVRKSSEGVNKADLHSEAPVSCLTTTLVDTWCRVIKEKHQFGTLCNLLKAYRTACHYGDGEEDEFTNKYAISSSHVFNKVMFFTLSEVDSIFRKILGIDMKEASVFEPQKHSQWKKLEPLVKSYLGNTLHILTQMTDDQMITFTLKRLKASTSFLGALPRFSRKYLKVALHFWGRGEGTVSLISFLFIRDMCLLMGTDQLVSCLKGIYKEFTANSKFVSAAALPRIQFLINCVVELYGIDLAASYEQAFMFIRQLAIVLRNTMTMKTKESYRNVYNWQYINCLELWVHTLCAYAGKKDIQPLVYPLTQVIVGVAQLAPTARYFPLRLHCVRLLNKLAKETSTYIPVSGLLLDMLDFKELRNPPTGGLGKSIDFKSVLKVSKATLKTRAFQDECVSGAIEQFSEHLCQWSYAISFPELALIPLIALRRFAKQTKVDRFRRQVKQLVDHIEQNVNYITQRRNSVNFSPKDADSVASFLQEEKKAQLSPLSKFAASLRQSAEQRHASLHTSSVLVKEGYVEDPESLDKHTDEDQNVFTSDWLPPKQAKVSSQDKGDAAAEGNSDAEDIVEELEMSSDDDFKGSTSSSDDERSAAQPTNSKSMKYRENKKQGAQKAEDSGRFKAKNPKRKNRFQHKINERPRGKKFPSKK